MRIHDLWPICCAVAWILFCYLPISITQKGTRKPLSKWDRIIFSSIGWLLLLLWYSRP